MKNHRKKDSKLAEKDSKLAEKDSKLAEIESESFLKEKQKAKYAPLAGCFLLC